MNIKQFVRQNNIKISAEYGTCLKPEDFKQSDPWKVTLSMNGRQITTPFFKGYGHGGEEPTAEEVLKCLILDYSGWDSANDFEDWASDLGFDTDSRKAERTYKQIEKQSRKLKNFLGQALIDDLMACEF